MARRWKTTGLWLAVAGFVFWVLIYAPLPGLETPPATIGWSSEDEAARIQENQLARFDEIRKARNLQRPFPQMIVRSDNPTTPEKVELGRLLYFDPILSGDNDLSCAHCHHPDLGFSDNRGVSMGRGGKGIGPERRGGAVLRRGSPTIWNAAYNHAQFWDGRARDLEDQARSPIQDSQEMAQDSSELVQELRAIPEYVALFQNAFGGEAAEAVTFQNVVYAIAAFERTIISNNSRFDRYARGEHDALSPAERRGLNVFRSLKTRCFECHNFPTFANPDFKVIGVPDLPGQEPDLGRGEIDGPAYNRAFKVPTLRNVALTAPYMHNGVFQTLEEVIDFYAGGGGRGLGLDIPNIDDKIRAFGITKQEKQDLIAFLHALTDESNKPEIPDRVPSGLPVVPRLQNQSPELAAFQQQKHPRKRVRLQRVGRRIIVRPGQSIQAGIDMATAGDTVWVMPGVYHETLTLDVSGITLLGQVVDGQRPVLDGRNVLADGLIGSGSDVEIRNFVVRNYTANGLMLNGAVNVTFRDLLCENPGLYGVYPVECVNVLIERCEVTGARDAGIYVGQSRDIVVRDSRAYGNVTGIEIENCVNALVENNEAFNNAGGILVFLLPNNPSKVSLKTRVVNNRIYSNNHVNFADPNAIVSKVPSGSGLLILAADEVEATGNEIRDNRSFGLAVIGLDMVFGPGARYDVDPIPERNWFHGNRYENNGFAPQGMIEELGFKGKDIIWDLSGYDNSWDEPGASSMPAVLPKKSWPDLVRRANWRFWRLLMRLMG